MKHLFPPSLVAAEAALGDIFIDEAAGLGITRADAERLFMTLPAFVRSARAVKFALGPDWRYEFGDLFHMDDGSRGFGIPHQAPLVVSLVRASKVADRVFANSPNRRMWWQELDNPAKHLDAIVEMLAVAKVSPDYELAYEQKGRGIGSHKIDWSLTTNDRRFLLEVKNRPGQTVQELERIRSTSRGGPKLSEEPLADFTKLFKSTSNKFLPTANASCLQGVIVFLGIKVPAAGLNEYFRHHLQDKLHFIALAKEDKDNGILVNLLATSEEIARRVLTAFNWQQTGDLIY